MEEVIERPAPVGLFNSKLETGTRAVIVLEAAHPRALDLARLTWFDHLVVHTGDAGGPPSLHPALPERTGELLVRRRLVEDSLTLMRRVHLIDAVADEHGVSFRASDEAAPFVDLMRTEYAQALKVCAKWLVAQFADLSADELARRVEHQLDRWSVEFSSDSAQPGGGT
ncbi:MAG: ABC-three component system middle component 2 [Pseudomonadota bacterium]